MRRELGLGIQGDRPLNDYARIASMAEDYGFDVLSVFSDFMYQPALVPLLIAAQHSRRVRLGPACLNPFVLHPVEIAGQVAALDLASDGRAYLGLARGAWLEQAGIRQARPLRALREAAEVVQHLLSGDSSGYAGEIFSLAPGTRLQYQVKRQKVPLLIGTWSRMTAALAGEIADEVKIGGSANPAMVARMRQMLTVGSARAGRPDDAVGIVVGAVTVVAEDGNAARALARTAAAMYVDIVAKFDPATDAPSSGSIDARFLSRFAIAGTPDEIVAQVQTLFEAGANRIEFGAPYGLSSDEGIRLLGERVLPQLRPA